MTNPEGLSTIERLGEPVELFPIYYDENQVATVHRGIFLEHAAEVVKQSASDPALIYETPRDFWQRFETVHSLIEHAEDDRRTYYTMTVGDRIGGLMWIGKNDWPSAIGPSPDNDLAIRTYSDGRGQGLAKPFIKFSVQRYLHDRLEAGDPSNGMWLETNADNPAAVNLYLQTGWEIVDHRWHDDILGTPRPRYIMQLDTDTDILGPLVKDPLVLVRNPLYDVVPEMIEAKAGLPDFFTQAA